MRRGDWSVLLALVVFVAAGCGSGEITRDTIDGEGQKAAQGGSTTAPTTAPEAEAVGGGCSIGEVVKVGVVFSQTGGAAVYGATQRRGVELAADELNESRGVTYELIIEDDASDPAQGITAFEKLIYQVEVSVIIGPTLSNTAFSTDPIAQEAGVPVLGVSNTATGITEIGDYILRNSLTEQQVIPQTIEVANASLGLAEVALLYGDDDAFTVAGYEVFVDALERGGIAVSTTQTFAKGDTDFAPQLTAVREAAPDALVVSALAQEAALIVGQARELGLDLPIIGGNGFNSPAIIEQTGEASEGVIVGAAWNSASGGELTKAFIAAFEKSYGSPPDQFAAQAYAGMHLVAVATEKACSADRPAIRDALADIRDVETVLGQFSFTAARDADHPAVVQIVQDGRFAVLP